ncbi:hypothetical protein [Pontibacter mangrovi]|uniref:Uncharacterized protein n=1 Tax=Pontibacter mangrovi TaxID=2589816 RepID=A0A501W7D6_9BACT|nr:hypothetical protein [Pontibacter mangrovi]TPE44505.1 hypothetical protein FJM65_10225 [Pontibacter mangrovi]
MKKGIIAIVFAGFLSLLLFYLLRPNSNVEFYDGLYEELLKEMMADSSVVEAYDENGKLIFTRRDTVSESVELVNSPLSGDVFYGLAKDEDRGYLKKEVFKYEYRKEDLSVGFSNDTASASAPFEAAIYLNTTDIKNASISIRNNDAYTVKREEGDYRVRYLYRAKATKKGVNTFEAKVTLHGEVYPVQFNYFVK